MTYSTAPWPNPLASSLGLSIGSLHLTFHLVSPVSPRPPPPVSNLADSVASVARTFVHQDLMEISSQILRGLTVYYSICLAIYLAQVTALRQKSDVLVESILAVQLPIYRSLLTFSHLKTFLIFCSQSTFGSVCQTFGIIRLIQRFAVGACELMLKHSTKPLPQYRGQKIRILRMTL